MTNNRTRCASAPIYFLTALFLFYQANLFRTLAAPATLLFQDDFNRGFPGWTAFQPPGTYLDGPMRWQYNIITGAFSEQSNIYTDNATFSSTATAVMLINDAVAGNNFTYSARLTAGDDDGFGLIFGFQDQLNFYRVTFTRQNRTANPGTFPGSGWRVDRKVDNSPVELFVAPAGSFTNRANVPFDVTITVSGANLFSVTVVDDPLGAATFYDLVQNQPLPGPAGGQVGLMTWGMSGNTPRGFQIQNLNLSPGGLVGNPNPLTDWTPVVPFRSGTNNLSGGLARPNWYLSVGANGPFGVLTEDGDALGGNDNPGQTNFYGPTLLAGNVNWTNYVVSARITPMDDDGHGIILRYQDETNFYRIALRTQSSGSGVRRGLSVQKVINGVYDEVAASTQFIPSNNIPYDILAAISGDSLSIVVISNALGVSKAFSYGPFNIAPPTLDHGKVGVHSWAMNRTEYDFVTVEEVNGVGLKISSAFDTPSPPAGLQDFAAGTEITASVTSPFEDQPGVRRVSTGFTGFGSVPTSGVSNHVTFTLTTFSLLNWDWRTEYLLSVSATAGGSVTFSGDQFLQEGSSATVTATANAGFLFVGWSGDSLSTVPSLNLTMNRPFTLRANFAADSDSDGMADDFEQSYFGNLAQTAGGDADGDGRSNLDEYLCGSDPRFDEMQVVSDGLSSRWENVQRDPVLPGQFQVRDFGPGYRGVWENSNDNRNALDTNFIGSGVVNYVSFEGPRLVIRTNNWDGAWSNFTAQAVFVVGDNDANNLYFRYQNESNWYRITICGENPGANTNRPPLGISLQKRVNGAFAELTASDPGIFTDPADVTGYKQVRVTVAGTNSDFEVRVIGYNVNLPGYDPISERVITFADSDLPNGRLGIGAWGQGAGGPATVQIPVDSGVLIDDIVVTNLMTMTEVFREDWETATLGTNLAGFSNPLTGTSLAGDWRVSAHATIMQLSNQGPTTSGTLVNPKADADGPILLLAAPGGANYSLEIGFHPYDNDGIGFVYDFEDTNNYARVLFVSEASGNARVPQGLNVSRKTAGIWSDIVAGDNAFIYQQGQPFAIKFSNNDGEHRLSAWRLDNPGTISSWTWNDQPANPNNRFGLAVWAETDGHFLYARANSLPELRITSIAISGGMVTLTIVNSTGAAYDVQFSTDLTSWNTVAMNQGGAQWSGAYPGGSQGFYRLRRVP